jgi:hypothetical protein
VTESCDFTRFWPSVDFADESCEGGLPCAEQGIVPVPIHRQASHVSLSRFGATFCRFIELSGSISLVKIVEVIVGQPTTAGDLNDLAKRVADKPRHRFLSIPP